MALVCAALIAGVLVAPARAGDAAAGAVAYARDCARCHRDEAALRTTVAGAGAPAPPRDALIARHRAPDPVRRADIVAYLAAPR
jgi:mono/diheme cytochrome c family protein